MVYLATDGEVTMIRGKSELRKFMRDNGFEPAFVSNLTVGCRYLSNPRIVSVFTLEGSPQTFTFETSQYCSEVCKQEDHTWRHFDGVKPPYYMDNREVQIIWRVCVLESQATL